MLQQMRSTTGSWVAKAILGLLVLSFVAWGVSRSTFVGSNSNTVAEVGSETIDLAQFARAYTNFKRQQNLNGIDGDTERQLRLADAVLGQMTGQALFQAEATSLDLTASDGMVRKDIESKQEFQKPDGTGFDRQRFNFFLQQAGLTEADYVSQDRRDLARGIVIDTLTAGSAAPSGLVDRLFNYFGERRSADYLSFPINSVADPGDPGDEVLKKTYEERKEDLRRPELRQLTYVLISPENLAAGMDIPEDAIKAAYEQRKAEFTQPEQRTVSQILFPSEEEAKAAAAALKATAADAIPAKVEELGLKLITLGAFTKDAIPNASLADAAFSLQAPGASEAFESDFGWSVAVVTAIQPGVEPSFADVRQKLRDDLALDKAYNEVFEHGKQLEDSYGQGMTLEQAAEASGLKAEMVASVDSTGHDAKGDTVPGLPAGLTFLRSAFDLEKGEVSFLTTTEANAQFMVRVDSITPAAIPEFSEVRAKVLAAWQEEARRDAADIRAETLTARLDEGASLSLLGQMMEADTASVDEFARTGKTAKGAHIPAALAEKLFALEPGKAAYAADGDKILVARLTKITPAAEAVDAVFRDNLSDAIMVGMAQDLVEQMAKALQDKYDVKTYPDVYERVYP